MPGFEELPAALGLDEPAARRRLLEGDVGAPAAHGRGTTTIIELPGRPERLHLRRVLHGGALGGLWRGRVAGIGRVRDELLATATLRARGADVPRPALALGQRSGLMWRASIATVHEESSLDGLAFLATEPTPAQMARAAGAAGAAIRRFHDQGGRHRDLHVGNLLVLERDDELRVVVIDLDRCRVGSPPSPARRRRELLRLRRSLAKRGLEARLGSEAITAFVSAYRADAPALSDAVTRSRAPI